MLDWIQDHALLLGAISAGMFVASALAVPVFVARMPADHFLHEAVPLERWKDHHPLLRGTLLVLKNLLGVVLVVAGVAMLVLPGQGLVAILVGFGLLDFPGKRRIEIAILSRKPILRVVSWMRGRANQPPLQLPPR